ncbi:MAG: PAS domain S-box protein [Bacteroidales bacterium]|nr:PAS domain S-box protein [Bacteroidales bacterium]
MSNSGIHKSKDELEAEILKLRKEISQLKEQQSNSKQISRKSITNEKLFHSIFEEAGIGIAIIDKNSKIVKFNKIFTELFGYQDDELLDKTYFDMIPIEKRSKAKENIKALLSSKTKIYKAEQTYLKKDQSVIWLKLTATIISDKNGNPEYILGIGEDITEYKRQEKIRDVVYNISNAVNYSDNLFKVIQTIKYSLKTIIDSKHFFIAIYNEFQNNFSVPYIVNKKETFETFPSEKTLAGYVLKNKKSVLFNYKEIIDLQKAGEVYIAGILSKQWLGVPLISDEKVIGVLGVQSFDNENAFSNDDLSVLEILSNQICTTIQKMRSEDALRIERAYFKELFDHSPEAIAIVDNSSKIININQEFTNLFGYSKNEAINKSIEDLISTPDFKDDALKLTYEVAQGKIIKIDTKRKKKDGNLVDVSLWGTPVIMDEGQLAVYAIFRDITERVESEKKLESAKEKAEESDKLKTAFLTNMSHEIRTPMNAIIGFSELLADPVTDQESRKEFTEQIYLSSKMLMKLIDDIIDISQIDSGSLNISREKFNLSELLYSTHKNFNKERLKENKNEIEVLLHNPFGDYMVFIETDELRLQQIFDHLLNNALKYTNEGFIELGFDTDQNEQPVFYVRDTGIGIPEDKTETIFDHFTKIEDHTKIYRGTGIGLTITKKLVNLLGGKISVESNIGIGSIFYFTLPDKVSIPVLHNQNTPYNWAGINILVAEDEDTNFYVIKASLSRTHANLVRVISGDKAVEQCKQKNFDIVLMDIKMPVMDGMEATKQIKAFNPDIPIIAQTAYVMKNERDTCIEAGCDDYIPKPIKSYILLEAIQRLLP